MMNIIPPYESLYTRSVDVDISRCGHYCPQWRDKSSATSRDVLFIENLARQDGFTGFFRYASPMYLYTGIDVKALYARVPPRHPEMTWEN